jgi:hypothetical protein
MLSNDKTAANASLDAGREMVLWRGMHRILQSEDVQDRDPT